MPHDPDDLMIADQQGAPAPLGTGDLVIDEKFFELLAPVDPQGQETIPGAEVTDY
jgi:hypothetical protein